MKISPTMVLLSSSILGRAISSPIFRQKSTGISKALISSWNIQGSYAKKYRYAMALAISSRSNSKDSVNKDKSLGAAAAIIAAVCFTSTALQSTASSDEDPNIKPADKFAHTALYPPIAPLEEGTLKVSDIHTISYSLYGNPNGKPVLFVHGGPGGGTDPVMARYFDPKTYFIILVDQRGCGKSTPFACLDENSTYDLVSDFEKLREKLGIQKWQVFGGSWGSCLGLAYAIEHPERVTELVLRGIFLLRKKELDWLYQGPGANFLFPEDFRSYEQAIPEDERHDFMTAYSRRLKGEFGEEAMHYAAKCWSVWEGRVSKLHQDPWETINQRFGEDHFALAFARIENHYFMNKGWFPREGYLLEKAQIDRIRHIPTVIVQGRYDVVCPAVSAYELKEAFPEAELIMTHAGHSGLETENIRELVAACDRFRPT